MGAEKNPLNFGERRMTGTRASNMTDKPVIKDDELLFYYGGNKYIT